MAPRFGTFRIERHLQPAHGGGHDRGGDALVALALEHLVFAVRSEAGSSVTASPRSRAK